jgi:hypothetical protein
MNTKKRYDSAYGRIIETRGCRFVISSFGHCVVRRHNTWQSSIHCELVVSIELDDDGRDRWSVWFDKFDQFDQFNQFNQFERRKRRRRRFGDVQYRH